MQGLKTLKVRTNLSAGQTPPGFPGQYGWWWMNGGYIARPGRPIKAFTGWWFGPSPMFYYPGGYDTSGTGAGMLGAPQGDGDGQVAPPAP